MPRRGLTILTSVALATMGVHRYYRSWLSAVRRRAHKGSLVAPTSRGPVEYDVRGDGPAVLHFHGGNVGHNGWFFLEHLVVSRLPGAHAGPARLSRHPARRRRLTRGAGRPRGGTARQARASSGSPWSGISAGGPGAHPVRGPTRAADVGALVLLSAISHRTRLCRRPDRQRARAPGMTRRVPGPRLLPDPPGDEAHTELAMQDFVQTETTYDKATGKRLIEKILADPAQKRQVMVLADAMVPALPRFDGRDERPAGPAGARRAATGAGPRPDAHRRQPVRRRHRLRQLGQRRAGASRTPSSITVDQFGHFIWWGDPAVRATLQWRIEAFLGEHAGRLARSGQQPSR